MSKKTRRRKRRELLQQQGANPGPPSSQQGLTAFQVKAQAFSGPIPPPNMLQEYNEIIPDGANRIMQMAEAQLVHRHKLESEVITGNLKAARVGQVFAFILAVVMVGGGFLLMAFGQNDWGVAAVITAATGLLAVFLAGRRKQDKERDRALQALPDHLK